MIVRKLKYNFASASCNVTFVNEDGDDVAVKSKKQCKREFTFALNALRKWAAFISELVMCKYDEIDESALSMFDVNGVSVDYDKDTLQIAKVVLSAKKRLDSGLVLSFDTPSIDDDYPFFTLVVSDVEDVLEEARKYIEESNFVGAQQSLPFGDE